MSVPLEEPPEASALLSPREGHCVVNPCEKCAGPPNSQCGRAFHLLVLQALAFVGGAAVYMVATFAPRYFGMWNDMQALKFRNEALQERNRWLREEIDEQLKTFDNKTGHPFHEITGRAAHTHPVMYGKVRERTIWSYYHHPDHCNTSKECTLPAYLQLCTESVRKNKGDFDYRILHADEAEEFVSLIEIPVHWRELDPLPQRDALMNALLARYGGVALDISTVLLQPLDDMWEEMVKKGATFRGYMYRINGQPWPRTEVTVMWFLMSRREGVFSTAVRSQLIGMGDRRNTQAYLQHISALGDQTLLPILSMYNYSWPKCFKDPTVKHHWQCPENEQKPWYLGITGPARNDTRILVRDPRDGPQLPFQDMGAGLWNVFNSTSVEPEVSELMSDVPESKSEMRKSSKGQSWGCSTMKECWDRVFLPRYLAAAEHGEARLLDFVRVTDPNGELMAMSRQEIMSDPCSYFYNWLRLARVPSFTRGCGQRMSSGMERAPQDSELAV